MRSQSNVHSRISIRISAEFGMLVVLLYSIGDDNFGSHCKVLPFFLSYPSSLFSESCDLVILVTNELLQVTVNCSREMIPMSTTMLS